MVINRLSNLILIVLFSIGVTLPVGAVLIDASPKVSQTEKRELSIRPGMPRSIEEFQNFSESFENYFNDHFGFREFYVRCYSHLKYAMGVSPSEKVVIGKNKWLFYAGDETIKEYTRTELFTPQELNRWATSLQIKYNWLKKQKIPYIFMVAPSKYTIYCEYLPDTLRPIGDISRYDQLFAYLKQNTDVPILDLRPVLMTAKDKSVVYSQIGTHWNYYGAGLAHYEIIKSVQQFFPFLEPLFLPSNRYDWVEDSKGDVGLANMISLPGRLKQYTPKLDFVLPYEEYVFDKKDYPPRTVIMGKKDARLRAVFFCDSFSIGLRPFLSPYFNRIAYIWKQPDLGLLKEYVKKEHPDIVLEERVERLIRFVPNSCQ